MPVRTLHLDLVLPFSSWILEALAIKHNLFVCSSSQRTIGFAAPEYCHATNMDSTIPSLAVRSAPSMPPPPPPRFSTSWQGNVATAGGSRGSSGLLAHSAPSAMPPPDFHYACNNDPEFDGCNGSMQRTAGAITQSSQSVYSPAPNTHSSSDV